MHRFLRPIQELSGVVLLGIAVIVIVGCSRPQRAGPVNPSAAREALRTSLESWKKGDQMRSLRERSPAIVVQDLDWEAGYRLIDYQIIGDGKDDNVNLLCPVQLTLVDKQGRQVKKKVSYIVSTDPRITVFREISM
ncbi:MAG TPA: hypothetical protein VG013_42250 [Gemmataceae bacterium]|nr:hypothetical protein [Gemmataceae bacterium]